MLNKSVVQNLTPLFIGGLIGIGFLYYLSVVINVDLNLEELALGEENTASYSSIDENKIHCGDLTDAQQCIDNYYGNAVGNEVVLWLGNSQLHTINQMEDGDELSSSILHKAAKKQDQYFLTFSQPNSSLQEHYLLFEYLLQNLPISYLILPVVFDDLRETGIRGGLIKALENEEVIKRLSKRNVGKILISNQGDKDAAGNDMGALAQTTQEVTEKQLNSYLEDIWGIWKQRPEFRGHLMGSLYLLRNWIFGITPSSTRRMIPGRYSLNMQAMKAILHSANEQGIKVLVYIVPLRDDVKIPYDLDQYDKFKSEVELSSKSNYEIRYVNFEKIVPANLWGSKASTTIGGGEELDFMHFKAGGHKILADGILSELVLLWSKEE